MEDLDPGPSAPQAVALIAFLSRDILGDFRVNVAMFVDQLSKGANYF